MISETIESPHAKQLLISNGWFELKVAKILADWTQAKKVWLNTKFNNRNQHVANEIDVIVETRNDKLLFVECKTHMNDNTFIDKFNTVVKNYGGLAAKRAFAIFDTVSDDQREKCDRLGISIFCTQEVQRTKLNKQQFYDHLDQYINSNNAR